MLTACPTGSETHSEFVDCSTLHACLYNSVVFKRQVFAACCTIVPDLCPRMRVTLTCGTTVSHKTPGREHINDLWLETFGDHSCTLLLLKHVTFIHVIQKHNLLTSTVVLALTVSYLNVIIAENITCSLLLLSSL